VFCRLALACVFLLGAGCARQGSTSPAGGVKRLAILPFENLDADPALDGAGRTLAAMVAAELAGSATLDAAGAETMREAQTSRAARVVHGYLWRHRQTLRVRAVVRDLATSRTLDSIEASAPAAGGLVAAAAAVITRLGGAVRPFGTRNQEALRHYGEALGAQQWAVAAASFARAVEADPAFGEAHLGRAQALMAGGDRDSALRAAQGALANRERLADVPRARLEALAASLERDPGARAAAQEKLARLLPADRTQAAAAGEAMVAARNFADGVAWYRKAVAADPAAGSWWNQLGYAQAYTGDLEGAQRSLEQYRALEPANANPLDSLGEVSFLGGRFEQAERWFLQAAEKAAPFARGAFLWKAAESRRMRGDAGGARELLRRQREPDAALAQLRMAQWEFASGGRRQAMQVAEQLAARLPNRPDLAALALSQLAVWSLESGQTERARRFAQDALRLAAGPPVRPLAFLCRFITQPPASAAEWAERADRAFPNNPQPLKSYALGYALLFSRHFREAAPVFAGIHRQTAPASAGLVQTLLAWTLIESGRWVEARPLVVSWPLPNPGVEAIFQTLVFPRVLFLRGALAEKEGQTARAREHFRLFVNYAGDLPAVFGEQRRAREALAQPASSR